MTTKDDIENRFTYHPPKGNQAERYEKTTGPIEKAWESYAKRVIDPNAPRVQLRESRRAFFGGAAAVFGFLTENVSGGDEITPADMDMMESIAADLRGFADAVRDGAR